MITRDPMRQQTRWTLTRALTIVLVLFSGLLLIYLARSPRPSTPPAPVVSQPEDWLEKVTAPTAGLVAHSKKAGTQRTPATRNLHNILHSFAGASLPIVKHAAQMGYDYIGDKAEAHQHGLGRIRNTNGADFWIGWVSGGTQKVESPSPGTDILSPLTQADLDAWNFYCSVKNASISPNDPTGFPNRYHVSWVNDANGWYFCAIDVQRQAVIEAVITYFVTTIRWDEVDAGFIDQLMATGYVCVAPHTHEYATYQQGKAELYRRLVQMFHARGLPVSINPAVVSQVPASTYQLLQAEHYFNEWGGAYNNDFGTVPASMVSVEVAYPPSWPAPGNRNDFGQTLTAAGIAGSRGAWFGAYGETLNPVQADGSGFMNNAIQLLRAIPNWDNLRGATRRSWDGRVYKSSNSYADANVVYSRHGKNGKPFVVFRNTSGVVRLRPGASVTSVKRADKLFVEAADGEADLSISGGRVRLANPAYVNVGYILTVTGGR